MRKRPRPDQIASILREFQADLDAGLNIDQACFKAGIGPTTYYRWKAFQEYPVSSEQFCISELVAEVDRLELLVAELGTTGACSRMRKKKRLLGQHYRTRGRLGRNFAPKGPKHIRTRSPTPSRALKGRHTPDPERPLHRPFRAGSMGVLRFPGRCPGLVCCAPSGQITVASSEESQKEP